MYTSIFRLNQSTNYVITFDTDLLAESWLEAFLKGLEKIDYYRKHGMYFGHGVCDINNSESIKGEVKGMEVLLVSGPIIDKVRKSRDE